MTAASKKTLFCQGDAVLIMKEKECEFRMMDRNPLILNKFVFLAGLLLVSLGFLCGVQAQTSTVGNISGTVRDPNGAVVGKAEVTILEERTGFTRTVKTDDAGFYLAPSLQVGR